MKKSFSTKVATYLLGLFATGWLVGCGSDDELVATREQSLAVSKAASINQSDVDHFISDIKLRDSTLIITNGAGVFTPSSELSEALYGDPDGNAHRSEFTVPPMENDSGTVEVVSLEVEPGPSGVSLSGNNATVRVFLHGLLHATIKTSAFGDLPADIQIRSSSISPVFIYDQPSARLKVTKVTSNIDFTVRNCGGSGWCNSLVSIVLRSKLAPSVNAAAQEGLNAFFDDPQRTQDFQDILIAMYNRKDPADPAWTMYPATLTLVRSMFQFTVTN